MCDEKSLCIRAHGLKTGVSRETTRTHLISLGRIIHHNFGCRMNAQYVRQHGMRPGERWEFGLLGLRIMWNISIVVRD